MTIKETIEDLKEFDMCQVAEWLEKYKHMRFQISEILVDVDKQHISCDKAIEKIRDVVRKYY